MKRVAEMGEEEVVARLLAGLRGAERLRVGPGDDCAVVAGGEQDLLLKTDAVVEGVHFLSDEEPRRVGRKAVGRVLSDFGAMGGWPGEFLVTIALGADTPMAWLEELYAGMSELAEDFGAVIAGGETTAVPAGSAKVISVAGTGSVPRGAAILRSGGSPGDVLMVTGRLGGSLAGWHLDFLPRLREATWLRENFKPTALMDLSDGLGRDLPRLARASGSGFELAEGRIPRHDGCSVAQALGDGEDYELLLAMAPEQAAGVGPAWREAFPDLELTEIGRLVEGEAGSALGGWAHFS
ncbi:MAG: thiamine-phosphate kinase [Verrucomicrobiales bacterium]